MKVVPVPNGILPASDHVVIVGSDELAAIRHALIRFSLESMADIEAEQDKHPESPLRRNWRMAQSLAMDLRDYKGGGGG